MLRGFHKKKKLEIDEDTRKFVGEKLIRYGTKLLNSSKSKEDVIIELLEQIKNNLVLMAEITKLEEKAENLRERVYR